MTDLSESQGLKWPNHAATFCGASLGLQESAASHRKAGRLDDADRTATFLMKFASRLVHDFPEDPRYYIILSEAHLQRSKNAWQREDFRGIKQALEQSVEALQRGLVLDPGDMEIHRLHQDRKKRLAGLPKS
jgi:hypothetical protein